MKVPEKYNNSIGNTNTLGVALLYNSKSMNVIPIPKPGEVIGKTFDTKLQKYVDKLSDGKSAEGYGKWDPWKINNQSNEDVIRLYKDKGDCNIAIVTGKVYGIIAFDIDGRDGEDQFYLTIKKLNDPEIEDAIRNTMQTKTGGGNGKHFIFRYNPEEFAANEVIKSKKLWIGKNEHSEISLKAEGSYVIAPPSLSITGNRYEFINDTDPITLSREKILKILLAFDSDAVKKDSSHKKNNKNNNTAILAIIKKPNEELNVLSDEQQERLIEILKVVYVKGQRDDIIFGLSGMLLKNKYSLESVKDFVNKLCEHSKDEQIDQRIIVVDTTYQKLVNGEEVTGISHLTDIFAKGLDSQEEAERLINSLSNILGDAKVHRIYQNFDMDIPDNILERLSNHVYKVISIGYPKKLIIAHSDLKQTVYGSINKYIIEKKNQDNSNNEGEPSFKYELYFGDILIDAIPTKVIIYDNPIDKSRKYEITFSTAYKKKPFQFGPGTLEDIISELQLRNKILKKGLIHDALSAIIAAFEETGKAIINDAITTPGYYINDKKLVGVNTNQLPFSLHIPTNSMIEEEEEVIYKREHEAVLSCIDLLEELNKKYREPIFATILKWACIGPLGYILKQKGEWIPYLYLNGWSNSGKTTLGIICLAVWRKYDPSEGSDNLLGFGNIDSIARFGQVVSRDTYPRVVNEPGSLSDRHYKHMVEIIKNSVDNTIVRGKIENYRNYVNIPALSLLIFTSNSKPPTDTGFGRRIIPIPFDKNDSKNDEEAKEFKTWLKPRWEILGILGDFTAEYIKQNIQLLDGNLTWEDLSNQILTAFYNFVGKELPKWVDNIVESNQLEESKNDVGMELRDILKDMINESYTKHVRSVGLISTEGYYTTASSTQNHNELELRFIFCFENELLSGISKHKNKQGKEMVCFNSSFLKQIHLKRLGDNLNTLTDIANEIPGFEYGNRSINGKSVKIAFGLKEHFMYFLVAKIEGV